MDDTVVKSDNVTTHLGDLEKVFGQLRKYNIRLNPEKCIFRVERGNFFGFMLTHQGIHANLDKCQTILEMKSPQNIKEAKCLADKIVSLSGFLPRIAKKVRPIIHLLKRTKKFVWDEDCEQAFQKLKVTIKD